MTYTIAVLLWLALLALAYPYVRRVKHPQENAVAAYLLFVTLFSAVASVLFLIVAWLISQLGSGRLLREPFGIAALMILVLIPAFLVSRWQIRKPPWRRPLPK